MSSALSIVRDVAAAAWRRPAPISVSQWAQENRRLDSRSSAETGRWDNRRAPYLVGAMDAFDLPHVHRLVFKKGEQLGGTEAAHNCLGKIIDRCPGPTLWIFPNDKLGAKVIRERVVPFIKASPALAKHLVGSPRNVREDEISFDRMTLRYAGSNSLANIESFAYKYLIIDELDRCKAGTYENVRGRGNTFPDYKHILLGTPELESPGEDDPSAPRNIASLFDEGDQCEFYVPCPHCGFFAPRVFPQVKWIGGSTAKKHDVARQAWFECPRCEQPIHGSSNSWQLDRGLWKPIGKVIVETKDERGQGGWRGELIDDPEFPEAAKVGAAWGGDTASFWIRGLLNPFQPNPYGYVAAEYVGNGCRMERRWANRRLGEEWKAGGYKIEASEMASLVTVAKDAEPVFKLGRLPEEPGAVSFITAAVDVQKTRMYVEVLGWGDGGRTQYLLDALEVPRAYGMDLRELAEVLVTTYVRSNRATGEVLEEAAIDLAVVDSSFFTDEVYRFVEPRQRGNWLGVKRMIGGAEHLVGIGPPVFAAKGFTPKGGSGSSGGEKPWRWSLPVRDAGGKPIEGSPHLFNFNSDWWKRLLYDAIGQELLIVKPENKLAASLRVSAGSGALGGTGLAAAAKAAETRSLIFPEGTPTWYLKQLVNERRLTVIKGNKTMHVWEKRGDRQNHMLDCRTMNLAILDAAKRTANTAAKIFRQKPAEKVPVLKTNAQPARMSSGPANRTQGEESSVPMRSEFSQGMAEARIDRRMAAE